MIQRTRDSFRAWIRPRGIAGLLLALQLWLALGCAHTASSGITRKALEDLSPQASVRAFVDGDRVWIAFGDRGQETLFQADWKGKILGKAGDSRFRTARLKLLGSRPPGTPPPTGREAFFVPDERVFPVRAGIIDSLAPAATREGVFLESAEGEFVIWRDSSHRAHLDAFSEASSGLRLVRRLNPTQFTQEVLAFLEEHLRAAGGPRRLLLVRATRPGDYYLFDLDRRIAVVLIPPGASDVSVERDWAHANLRALEAAVVEGQVLSAIKNPVSFLAKAANFAVQTVGVILRRRVWSSSTPPPAVAAEGPGMDLEAFEKTLDSRMGSRRYRGSIRLLVNGETFFPLLERRIDEARESLHFRVCIWDTDDVGVALADRVRRRSEAIGDVKIVIDRMTSLDASLTPPGTPMPAGFEPPRAIQPYLRSQSRVRVRNYLNAITTGDHSKVFLVDRKYAYVGGMNVGREYRHEWHDAMVELEGPIVGWLERDFELAWSHAGPLGDLSYAAAYLTERKSYEGIAERPDYVDVRPIYTKTGNPAILRALLAALARAKRYAWIENPYIYDNSIISALVKARARGVDVRVVMPSEADMSSADSNNKVKTNILLSYGVRVFVYPGMTHTKAAIVDGWAILGSCNFNKLSLRTNNEVDVATSDPRFADAFKHELFEADFASASELKTPLAVTGADRFREWLAHQL